MIREKKIACVILNYNDYKTTLGLVEHVKNYELIDHIIIVDNCSTDDSYNQLSKERDYKIVIEKTDVNKGYGAGNNYGIKLAYEKYNCDYAIIANPDIEVEQSTLEKVLDIYELDKLCAVVAPYQFNSKLEPIKSTAWNLPSYFTYVFSSLFLINKCLKRPKFQQVYKKFCKVDCVSGALLIVDIQKFLKVGGYDENIFLYCEENTLGYKLKKEKYMTYLAMDEKYIHMHAASTSKSIPNIVNRQRILYNSRLYYLRTYLHINKCQIILAKIIYEFAIIEEYIKVFIKKVLKRR